MQFILESNALLIDTANAVSVVLTKRESRSSGYCFVVEMCLDGLIAYLSHGTDLTNYMISPPANL